MDNAGSYLGDFKNIFLSLTSFYNYLTIRVFKSSPGYDTVQPFENPWSEQFVSILTDSLVGKESACSAGDPGSIPRSGRFLEKGQANHSGILAWRIPWTILFMGLQRVGHD